MPLRWTRITVSANNQGTRERLLQAAGEVFALRGFRAATVREICRRAEVNLAAVNYHFRDKGHLYETVLEYAHRYAMEKHPPDGGLSADAPAEQRLAAFVRSFLCRLTDKGRPAWHGLLMLREITEPTSALDTLVGQTVRPQLELVHSIAQSLLGPDARTNDVLLCASSIVGQCMHFQMSRHVLCRLNPALTFDAETIENIVRHVVLFSLAGIRRVREELEGAA